MSKRPRTDNDSGNSPENYHSTLAQRVIEHSALGLHVYFRLYTALHSLRNGRTATAEGALALTRHLFRDPSTDPAVDATELTDIEKDWELLLVRVAASDHSLCLCHDEGFGEDPGIAGEVAVQGKQLSRDARAFGYSYRIRPASQTVRGGGGVAADGTTIVQAPVRAPPSLLDALRGPLVPVPHHEHPAIINTALQCLEPFRRRHLLEDAHVFGVPRRAAAAGAEDFNVVDEVQWLNLQCLLNEVVARRSFVGLSTRLGITLFQLVLGKNDELYNAREEKVPEIVEMIRSTLAKYTSSRRALRIGHMQVHSWCTDATWAENTKRFLALLGAMSSGSDVLSSWRGISEVHSGTPCLLPDLYHRGFSRPSHPDPAGGAAKRANFIDTFFRLLLSTEAHDAFRCVLEPLMRGGSLAEACHGSSIEKSIMEGAENSSGSLTSFAFPRQMPLFFNSLSAAEDANGASDSGCAALPRSVPVVLPVCMALEAVLLLAEVLTFAAEVHEGDPNDGIDELLRAHLDDADGGVAMIAALRAHPRLRANENSGKLAALPLLGTLVSERLVRMTQHLSARIAIKLALQWERLPLPPVCKFTDAALTIRQEALFGCLYRHEDPADIYVLTAWPAPTSSSPFPGRIRLSIADRLFHLTV